ncbi:MAG TPA: DNA polymerase III subunit chi [Allosphingosinicella sp.]|uniref:DNA polymerase III subunit chi n=1 Tax=Allosphingosinicella sp. TaxID=2823234 RepID=UPI002ED8CB03
MLVDFYHLASSPLERVLPQICEKVLASGERLLIVAEERLLDQLDAQLWNYAPDAFLPHGRSNAEAQPVLLSTAPEAGNGATNVALADGQWREEALTFNRTFYFFDSVLLDEARSAWRALKGREGVEPRYWKQDERGKWVQGP